MCADEDFEHTGWEYPHETWLLLLFDDNKVKMARKPGKKQKENLGR